MNEKTICILMALCFFASPTGGANILILHPVYSGSHEYVLRSVGEHLVENRGHNVTQIRYQHAHMKSNLDSSVNVITLKIEDQNNECPGYINDKGEFDIGIKGAKELWDYGHTFYGLPTDMTCMTDVQCQTLFSNVALYEAINKTNYDLVILDTIANECSLAWARTLGAPIAAYWGFSFHGGEVMYTSVFNPPSIVPGFFSGYTQRMNFFQRLTNFILTIGHRLFMLQQASVAEKYIKRWFPNEDPASKMVHDIDLFLVNSNFFVDCPRLVSPDVKYVGGLHMKDTPLPKEYEDFINSSSEGVVLFSMGCTGFNSKDFPSEILKSFLKAFSRLPQKVIMRFDPEFVPFVPDNVKVANWVPQQSILGHPNVVAFVSHCGMGSMIEAIYHRVPIVGIGIFGDQLDNAARIVERGLGVQLYKQKLTEDVIYEAITEVITNKSYYKQIDRLSTMWRQQPMTPLEETTFWLEQLIEHGSLKHLKIDDYDLNLLQYFSIDVIIFLTILAGLTLMAIYFGIKKLSAHLKKKYLKKTDAKEKMS